MRLRQYLKDHELTVHSFAERLGCSRFAVYRYMTGERRPAPRVMERILVETEGKVTPNDFYAVPESPEGVDSPPATEEPFLCC